MVSQLGLTTTLDETVRIDDRELDVVGLIDVLWTHPAVTPDNRRRAGWHRSTRRWAVRDGTLQLEWLSGHFRLSGGPITASWVCGEVRLRDGDEIVVLDIRQGRVESSDRRSYIDHMIGRPLPAWRPNPVLVASAFVLLTFMVFG